MVASLSGQHRNSPLPRDFRRIFARAVVVFLFVLFSFISVLLLAIILLSSQKIEKNILIIKPIYSGQIDSFYFASISKNNNKIIIAKVAGKLELDPAELVLSGEADEQRRAQVSIQIGIPIDEIWTVDEIPEQVSKEDVVQYWSQQQTGFMLENWLMIRSLQYTFFNSSVVQLEEKSVSDLRTYQVATVLSSAANVCSVAIVNTTATSGVARSLTHLWEALGLVVVKVADQPDPLKRSKLILSENGNRCLQVQQVMNDMTPNDLETSLDPVITNQYRASMVFFIGEDLAELKSDWGE